MYRFMLEDYLGNLITLPLSPESFVTKITSRNKTYSSLKSGEINIIKDVGLRDFSFTVFLPEKGNIYFDKNTYNEPIFYLNYFRQIKLDEKPVRLMISRTLPKGNEIFEGNVLVTLENYTVRENAGEEGNFWVSLEFKEYVNLNTIQIKEISENKIVLENTTANKPAEKSYTVKKGDCLWNIARSLLNDSSRYKEIMTLNNITNVYNLQVGQVLKIPD